MSLKLFNFLAILVISAASSKYRKYVENIDMTDPNYPEDTSTADHFARMGAEIVYIDSNTVIRSDNHGERMMGVSDDKCDNARVNFVDISVETF